MRKLEQQFTIQYSYPVYFCRDIFQPENEVLRSTLLRAGGACHKVRCIIDSGVLAPNPFLRRKIECYAEANHDIMEICGTVKTIRGGERSKNSQVVIEELIDDFRRHHLCRQSFVLVIGGGAVLDAVGYAAAIVHRGLRLIRIPTTVLAQNDAGVGVKNGINAMGRKNFIGTFAPPFAVINDSLFLETLPTRQLRAGIAEAVKVALIKDRSFFDYLYTHRHKLAAFDRECMEELIHRCAALHVDHIGRTGDPFETGSARPLDFGHWSAHKLEELTGGKVNHGEAVAIGIALDSLYSRHSEMISTAQLKKIFTLLEDLQLPLFHPAVEEMDVPAALDEFQEHLGGERAVTLLTGIGSKKEVNRIDTVRMKNCIAELGVRFRKSDLKVEQPVGDRKIYQEIN